MESEHYSNPAGWSILFYGIALSFIAAFVPFFEAGFKFSTDLFLFGIMPYLLYAIAVPLLPGATTTTSGIALAVIHSALVVAVRFLGAADSLMFSVPTILALLVLPLVIVAVVKTDMHKHDGRFIRH